VRRYESEKGSGAQGACTPLLAGDAHLALRAVRGGGCKGVSVGVSGCWHAGAGCAWTPENQGEACPPHLVGDVWG
jgi:hypothetical protein